MEVWMDGRTDGLKDGLKDGVEDNLIDRQTERDRQTVKQTDGQKCYLHHIDLFTYNYKKERWGERARERERQANSKRDTEADIRMKET